MGLLLYCLRFIVASSHGQICLCAIDFSKAFISQVKFRPRGNLAYTIATLFRRVHSDAVLCDMMNAKGGEMYSHDLFMGMQMLIVRKLACDKAALFEISTHDSSSTLRLRGGGGFSMARPGSLKAAAKPTTPAWYNGADLDGNGALGLLVGSCHIMLAHCVQDGCVAWHCACG